jgi:hypothetical protein
MSNIPPQQGETGDATGGVIPYKNVPALIAYYLGVFSLIPCLGIPLGIGAVILGIIGLVKYKKTPQVRGVVHAWIGIALGSLMFLLYTGLIVFSFVMSAVG